MSTMPAAEKRNALKLPAGSVRAIHVLVIVAVLCATILVPNRYHLAIPSYLIYLLFLMLGHYFAAHGVSTERRTSPARRSSSASLTCSRGRCADVRCSVEITPAR